MREDGVQPNTVTYTALLTMWGASNHPKARLSVLRIFKDMSAAHVQLDLVGYRYFQELNISYDTIKFI